MTNEERKLVLHYLKYEAETPRLYSNSKADSEYWEIRVKALQKLVDELERPCEDCISRRDMALNIVSFYNKATGKKKTLDFLCKCVEGLPSVQPKTEWIPVSERLPDNDCECWVTTGDGMGNIVRSCNYTSDLYDLDEYSFEDRKGESGFYDYDSEYGYYEIYNVIAWMPYFEPKPYKAESEVQDADSD